MFYEVKKKKREILLHFQSFLYWKVFKKSKIAQIYSYDPQSAGINMQSPQSDLNSLDTNSSLRKYPQYCRFQKT